MERVVYAEAAARDAQEAQSWGTGDRACLEVFMAVHLCAMGREWLALVVPGGA